MSDEHAREQEHGGPEESGARRAVRGGAAVIVGLLALVVGGAIGGALWSFATARAPEPSTEVLSARGGADVVAAVRDLSRLESTSFHMERVIELTSTQRHLFGLVEAEDTILLVAAADVVAGIDLAEIRDGDVVVDREARRARIVLPAARVLGTHLDEEHTFVHSRSTDLLARRREDLEGRARQEAEHTLEQAAIEAGILDRAQASAERTVEALVRSLGYEDVVVEVRGAGAEQPSIEGER